MSNYIKMKSLLDYSHSAKCVNLWLLLVFAGGVFLQCVLFSWLAFHNIAISSLWKNPCYFWSFYLPKLSIALLLGSFVFLFRRKYWTIYASVLINLWILAEVVYYRSTRVFITAESFALLKELHGFESSIGMYLTPDLLLLLIPTLVLIFGIILFDNRRQSLPSFFSALVCSIGLDIASANMVAQQLRPETKQVYFSCYQPNYCSSLFPWNQTVYAVQYVSVLHSFYYTAVRLMCKPFEQPVTLSEADINEIQAYCEPTSTTVSPAHPLVLILVESMESWAIRPDITPNLYRFTQEHNVVYARHTKSQTLAGNSADGQMLYNTGLLPIKDGVVANSYSQNVFPSLSDMYRTTAMIQPGELGVWNQYTMNIAYGIDTAYTVPSSLDEQSFQVLNSIIGQYDYILVITIASHSPFVACSHFSSLSLPDDMPANMRNYLLCMNYTDSCWGDFLQRIDTDSVLHNSVVCFMGDHIIFDPIMRKEFQDYCDRAGLDYQPQEAYTAFVAYSPDLTEKTTINEVTYQMDAYPTIRHLIGADTYYWKGFGIDLSDTTHTMARPINEQDAYIVSDKIIRANYFKDYFTK